MEGQLPPFKQEVADDGGLGLQAEDESGAFLLWDEASIECRPAHHTLQNNGADISANESFCCSVGESPLHTRPISWALLSAR